MVHVPVHFIVRKIGKIVWQRQVGLEPFAKVHIQQTAKEIKLLFHVMLQLILIKYACAKKHLVGFYQIVWMDLVNLVVFQRHGLETVPEIQEIMDLVHVHIIVQKIGVNGHKKILFLHLGMQHCLLVDGKLIRVVLFLLVLLKKRLMLTLPREYLIHFRMVHTQQLAMQQQLMGNLFFVLVMKIIVQEPLGPLLMYPRDVNLKPTSMSVPIITSVCSN